MNAADVVECWTCPLHGTYAASAIVGPVGNGDAWVRRIDRCPTCLVIAKEQLARWDECSARFQIWRASAIPQRFQNRRLSNYRPTTPQLREAYELVQAWIESPVQGLVLLGPVGTGKTHLAIAAVAELVKRGRTTHYAAAPELVDALRAGCARAAKTRPNDVLEVFYRADVWVLDEIGATAGTTWEGQQVSQLIDDRYRRGLRFILVGNCIERELPTFLGARGADRLTECSIVVPVTGTSYRSIAATDLELASAVDDLDPGPRPRPLVCDCGELREAGRL
jgi:DNA replication protein DnaC